VDDDVLVHEDDCRKLLQEWRSDGNDSSLAGLFPMLIDETAETMSTPTAKSGFNALLTSAIMMPIKFIHNFKCDEGVFSHSLIDQVDDIEDVALNLLAQRIGIRTVYVKPEYHVLKIVNQMPTTKNKQSTSKGNNPRPETAGSLDDFFLPNSARLSTNSMHVKGISRMLQRFEMANGYLAYAAFFNSREQQ